MLVSEPITDVLSKEKQDSTCIEISERQLIQTAKLFEFYVRKIWRFQRPFVKSKLAKRCVNCTASEKMIEFQENGLCKLCADYQPEMKGKNKQDLEFSSLFKNLKTKNSDYDALILFSGGKDSTFMVKRLQMEQPHLKLLAFTLDNGFMSPVAKKNIERLIKKLDIDHLYYRPSTTFYKKLFRYTITHLNEQGGYGTVDFSDGEFLLDSARIFAYEKKIPFILCGYSKYQVQNGLGLNHFESSKEFESRKTVAGIPLHKIFSEESELKKWWDGSKKNKDQVARLIFPLYAWDLEEAEILKQVKSWGLLNEKNQSPIVTNHLLIPLIGVVDVHQLGYSSFEIEFSRMIREGKADRKEWLPVFEFLEYCAKTGFLVKSNVRQILKVLNLTLEQVKVRYT